MAGIRGYLLAVIGVVGAARAAAQTMKDRPQKSAPALSGMKRSASLAAVAVGLQPLRQKPAAKPQGKATDSAEEKPVSVPGSEATHSDVQEIHGPFGYLKELFTRFSGDQCPAWAASLSFFAILAIPPILLCGLAVLSALVSPQEAVAQVEGLLKSVLPGGSGTATAQAQTIMQQLKVEQSIEALHQQRGVTGLIGVASLFWSAMQIFLNAMTPMNAAFRTKETRGFIKLRLVALGLLLGAGLLFLVSLIPSSLPKVLPFMAFPGSGILFFLLAVGINIMMYALIYRYLPSPSSGATWRSAFFAGAIAAVLWEIAKQIFTVYLARFGSAGYNKVYGSLGGVVATIFWIYYSSMMLLLGAEIAKLYQDARRSEGKKA